MFNTCLAVLKIVRLSLTMSNKMDCPNFDVFSATWTVCECIVIFGMLFLWECQHCVYFVFVAV